LYPNSVLLFNSIGGALKKNKQPQILSEVFFLRLFNSDFLKSKLYINFYKIDDFEFSYYDLARTIKTVKFNKHKAKLKNLTTSFILFLKC